MKYYIIRKGSQYVAGTLFKTRKEAEEEIQNNPNEEERRQAIVEEITDIELFNHIMRWIADLTKEEK